MMIARLNSLIRRVTGSRVLRDSSFIFFSNMFALGAGTIQSIILVHLLGAYNKGLVLEATLVVDTIVDFMDIRTQEGLIRFMGRAMARGEPQEAMTFFHVGLSIDLLLVVVTGMVAAIFAPRGAALYPQGQELQPLIAIYLFSIPFAMLVNTFSAVLLVFKRFRLQAALRVIYSLFSLICLTLLATQGLMAVAVGYVLINIFAFVIWAGVGTWLLIGNVHTLRGQGFPAYRAAARQFVPFAFHTSAMASLKAVGSNIDLLVLAAFRPPNEVEFLNQARNAAGMMTLLTTPVVTVIYPMMNEAWAKHDFERVKQLIRRYTAYSSAITGAAILFWFIFADLVVRLVLTPEFAPTGPLIRVLVVGVAIESVAGWVRSAALSNGKPSLVTFTGFASLMIHIVLALPLAYYYGATGVAFAYIAGVLVSVGLNMVYVVPRLGLWNPLGFLKPQTSEAK